MTCGGSAAERPESLDAAGTGIQKDFQPGHEGKKSEKGGRNMPRSVEAIEQIKGERRGEILEAALRIFTRKGYSATKMSDIAREAGVSYGLVYHYFGSKNRVYAELVGHAIDSLGRVIRRAAAEAPDPAGQLRLMTARVLDSVEHRESSGYYYVLVMQALTCETLPLPAAEIIGEAVKRLEGLAEIIRRGQDEGSLRPGDPMELAVVSFASVLGLASLKVSGMLKKVPGPEMLMRLF